MKILTTLPAIGKAFEGGFYGGQIRIEGQLYALIVAPSATGEIDEIAWADTYKDVPDAKSYNDGYANTRAMFDAGSKLGAWAWTLSIDGHTDWYLPSQDELEILYRNLRPTTNLNGCYARSGINLSAVDPTQPYTPEHPVQTSATAFQIEGDEAFEPGYYWTSTQHAGDEAYAWCQAFYDGGQGSGHKSNELRARAVRRFPI